MLSRSVRQKLPKAKLLSIEIGGYHGSPYWARFRLANAVRWQLWWVCIEHRAPWLEHSARQLHPQLFAQQGEGESE